MQSRNRDTEVVNKCMDTKGERGGVGLKDVWGYMIFWGGVFSTLVMFTCKSFFKESRISIIMVRASSMANVALKFYLFVCLLLNTVEFFLEQFKIHSKTE